MLVQVLLGLIVTVMAMQSCLLSSSTNCHRGLYQTQAVQQPKYETYRYREQTNKHYEPAKLDPQIPRYWPLANIEYFTHFTPLAQPVGTNLKPCSEKIIVAVIDTGIDYRHLELKDNLWHNPGEIGPWVPSANNKTACRDKSCNGIDDDKNGFKDDVIGWDFVFNRPSPMDTHGHGTHVAGIIAAKAANGRGAFGVCPNVSIMALKYYDNSGVGFSNLANTVRAIKYATRAGAHIINYSGGGSDPAWAERRAIQEARNKGILVIAAAGNNGIDLARQPYYPASYDLDNVIGVSATTHSNKLLSSSNYGALVAAPGLTIYSALPAQRFGTMSGTSQATAFVSGLAALLLSQTVDKDGKVHGDYRKTRAQILQGANPLPPHYRIQHGLISTKNSLDLQTKKLIIPKIK